MNNVAQNGGAAAKSFLLRFIKRQRNRGQRAVPTNEVRQRQRNAVAVRQSADARTNRQDRTLIVQQDVHYARYCAADAVIGRAFPGDDLIRRVTTLLSMRCRSSSDRGFPCTLANSSNDRPAMWLATRLALPSRHAPRSRMHDVPRIHIEMVSEQRPQARRIERRARPITRVCGTLNSAAKCAARCVMTSTGLVTTSKTASGAWRRIEAPSGETHRRSAAIIADASRLAFAPRHRQ